MEINQDILKKAKDKLSEEYTLEAYLKTCLKAMICPHCGEPIILKEQKFCPWAKHCHYICEKCGEIKEY